MVAAVDMTAAQWLISVSGFYVSWYTLYESKDKHSFRMGTLSALGRKVFHASGYLSFSVVAVLERHTVSLMTRVIRLYVQIYSIQKVVSSLDKNNALQSYLLCQSIYE